MVSGEPDAGKLHVRWSSWLYAGYLRRGMLGDWHPYFTPIELSKIMKGHDEWSGTGGIPLNKTIIMQIG